MTTHRAQIRSGRPLWRLSRADSPAMLRAFLPGSLIRLEVDLDAAAEPAATKPAPLMAKSAAARLTEWIPAVALGRGRIGFTLIELLTVISIIGVLMAIGIGTASVASRKARESRIGAELHGLIVALESYKGVHGNYPPDNVVTPAAGTTPIRIDPNVNQLFYELTGSISPNSGQTYTPAVPDSTGATTPLDSGTISSVFHTQGFVNSGTPAAPARNFLPSLRKDGHATIPTPDGKTVEILTLSVPWPSKNTAFTPPLAGLRASDPRVLRLNPWRYVSSSPTNNPGGFDLWAEIVIGNDIKRIANWRE